MKGLGLKVLGFPVEATIFSGHREVGARTLCEKRPGRAELDGAGGYHTRHGRAVEIAARERGRRRLVALRLVRDDDGVFNSIPKRRAFRLFFCFFCRHSFSALGQDQGTSTVRRSREDFCRARFPSRTRLFPVRVVPYWYNNVSNTLYSLCLTGDFVTQSASS